jgi:hypothetical protein
MKSGIKSVDDDFDFKKNRPEAGEERSFTTGEAIFFSPLPVPTGQVPADLGGSILAVNDAYIDIGSSNFNKAFQAQVMINTMMYGICLGLILIPFIVGMGSFVDPHKRTFLYHYIGMLESGAYIAAFSIVFAGGLGAYAILSTTFAKARSRPLRFNRQRREVCYFPDGSDEPIFQPWEDTVAWLSVSSGATGVGFMNSYTFGMAIDDPKADKVHFLTHGVMTPFHGMSKWEAIRIYMEKGPEFCPGVAPYEGRHTFDEKRASLWEGYRDGYRSALGVGLWYMFHAFTWWRIPYWIAEWDHRYSMKSMPECIAEWSKPLTPEQWAKPSEELLKQSAEIEKAFAEGVDFLSYFKTRKAEREKEVLVPKRII